MFKMLDPKIFALVVAWLTMLIVTGLDQAVPLLETLGVTARLSWPVFIVQAFVTIIFVTPAWRFFWWLVPPLSRWIYPDLNGHWDVELHTSWPRIDALLKAANHETPALDMRLCNETSLPPLGKIELRAHIRQSWLSMKIEVWDPKDSGPIKESQTLVVEPMRGTHGRHGLAYIFEQENATDSVSDDSKFTGAARLMQNRDEPHILSGRMWNDRMWRRGMNTAADVRFTKVGFPVSATRRRPRRS